MKTKERFEAWLALSLAKSNFNNPNNMTTQKKRSSIAPKRNMASKPIAKAKRPAYDRGNRIYIERIPEMLYKRFLKAAKQNNGNKADTLRKSIDLYCDVQEGKATVRRVKK